MGIRDVAENSTQDGIRPEDPLDGYDLAIIHAGRSPRLAVTAIDTLLRNGTKRVLFVTSFADPALAIEAISRNAVAYLADRPAFSATARPPETTPQPTRVSPVKRLRPIPGARAAPRENRERWEVFSAREIEILELVADGKKNSEISAVLELSINTVKGHLARIGRKMNTGDRARMVLLALRSGVIT